MYSKCMLCPRECKVNRANGEIGFCGASDKMEIGRASLHHWEEPSISGTNGSGTVFFAHCTLGCVYCQNRSISRRHSKSVFVDENKLSEIFLDLQQKNAHNINLVTAVHYTPSVCKAIDLAKQKGLYIPVLLNCGGYEKTETIKLFDKKIDIYLPDFKYYSGYYAKKYSNAVDYLEVCEKAIDEMVKQTGKPIFNKDGILQKGTVIRHLMLPNMLSDTKQVLRRIAENWGDNVLVSLMRQYTPFDMQNFPELNRKITDYEYNEGVEYFEMLGLSGYLQEGEAATESFIPEFNGEGIK